MTGSVDHITECFPNQHIARIQGEPSQKSISKIEKLTIENAASIHSNLGGGNLGYIGLVTKPSKYVIISGGTTFTEHPNPPTLPIIPQGSTQPQIAALTSRHQEEKRLYKEQESLKKALKNMITQAFDETFIEELKHPYTGYNNISIPDIFTFLHKTYGNITSIDLEDNEKRMTKPYKEDLPFGVFVKQIEDAVEYAEAGGEPFTNEQVVSKAYNLLIKSGVYALGCREWESKSTPEKTWNNLKKHFSKEYRLLRTQKSLGTTDSFDRANKMQEILDSQEAFQQNTETILQDLANIAKTSNEEEESNKKLKSEMEECKKCVQKLQNDVKDIYQLLANFPKEAKRSNSNRKYCWTHGSCFHSSKQCTNKADGHKDEATFRNRMAGSNKNCS